MNKIMEREYDYIRGNTAVNPNRKYKESNEEQRRSEIEKAQREKRRRLRALRDKRTKDVIHIGLVLCVLGVVTIMRFGNIYETQRKLTNVKADIKNVVADNEALRVDLFKVSSTENIKETAEKVGMITPKSTDLISVDMSKDYFPEKTKDIKVEKAEGLFSKFMGALKK